MNMRDGIKTKNKRTVNNWEKSHNHQLWVDINPTEQEFLSGGTAKKLLAHELTHTAQQISKSLLLQEEI